MYLSLKAVQWFTICGTSPPLGLTIGWIETQLSQYEEMDWNELNGIQNIKQFNSYECRSNSVSCRIQFNAFD